MIKRLLAAARGVPLVLLFVFFSKSFPILIDIAITIICFMCVGEFSAATGRLKYLQLSIPSLVFAVIYPMLMSYGSGMMIGYIYTGIMLSMLIFFHKKISFRSFAYIYSITIIITFALSSIISMKLLDPAHGAFYFVLSLGLPWMADIGAFFAGSYLGKHKLCPNISQKKTIEGAVGGVLGSVILCALYGLIIARTVEVESGVMLKLSLLIGFMGSLASIGGDLFASSIKRVMRIKDYSNLIPGHGGILDRFDSMLFVAPIVVFVLELFEVIL